MVFNKRPAKIDMLASKSLEKHSLQLKKVTKWAIPLVNGAKVL